MYTYTIDRTWSWPVMSSEIRNIGIHSRNDYFITANFLEINSRGDRGGCGEKWEYYNLLYCIVGPLPDYPQTTVDKVASVIEFIDYLIVCLSVSKYYHFSPHPPLSPLVLIGPLPDYPQRIRVCLSFWIQYLLDCLCACGQILSFLSSSSSFPFIYPTVSSVINF